MTFNCFYLLYCLINLVCAVNYRGPQARIVSENGHLILYAAEHKNISLETRGRGGVSVNGYDISKAAKISNSALEAMKKYRNFESSFEKINKFEQLLDDGLMQKIMSLQTRANISTDIPVNSASVVRSVRRLNRRVNTLQRSIRLLTSLLTKDECSSNPCKNAGTCQDLFNDYMCHCPPEWEGALCDKDVNECSRFSGTDLGCQNGATCINLKGSYQCLCPHGWFGIHCTRRTTDCQSGSNTELCGHGTCITQYNDVGYKCICDEGWTTDGRTPACNTDVNECTSSRPACSVNPPVQCINLPGSFHCGSCPQGYSGNGFYCADIDECATSNGGCSENPRVQCINTIGSRICGSCPPGYVGDGVTCSYQGVCQSNNGGCHHLATCRNNPRISSTYVECICPIGYVGTGIGPNGCVRTLQPTSGPCYPNPCRHGTCTRNGTNDYACSCYRRYTGRNCESYRDLCASSPCYNGATCHSFLGVSYRCVCPTAFTGLRCETEKQACGGRLQTETGVLAFPSGTFQTYGHTMSCAWTIETNSSKVLNITFSRFDVEGSHACRYDWLQIHDGKNTLAPTLGRFCGRDLPNGGTIISTHNIVYLWFRSDHSVSSTGFNLTWASVTPSCGEDYQEVTSHGTIQSPGSPGNYPNNRDCFWPLQAPAGKRLLFHFFTLMIGNDSNCDHDYLEFRAGTVDTDPVFAKFCNTSRPSPLFSSSSEVLVHFHSDATVTYPGFQITYSVVEGMPGCGGVYTRHQDEIRSPSYNGRYPNDIQCEYKIQLPPQSRIKITFLSFEVEDSEECLFDYVAIHDGSNVDAPLIGTYCGTDIPAPYVTERNVLFIVFKTDWSTTGGGFVLKYETVCGGKFTEPSGIITSPGYPNLYSHSVECVYEIIQPIGKTIRLDIVDLDMETTGYPECAYDFLEVRDGHDENSTLIGTYCHTAPPLIVSSYNYVWMKFQTDASENGRGFKANYTTVNLGCGGIMKEKSGTFSTPRYPEVYEAGQTCKWIISAPPGNVIQILWMNFQLESSYECQYDYVEIFDNNTETGDASAIGRYCGQSTPPTLLSTSNLVTVVFQADHSYSMAGFLASYNILLESNVCGGNYYTNAGTLKSPRYPDNYPLNIECTWTIQVKPGHQIMLNIIDFSLEKFSVCRYDWLEIRNGKTAVSPLLGKYCGTSIPKNIPSHANQLYIRFKSDMTKTEKGFKIQWEATATGCGGTLSSPTGSIISPNYPESYSINTECTWKISVSTGSTIQIVFSDLDLEEHTFCSLDYVEIFDGPTVNSKSLGKFCSSHPSYIRSSSNNLMVVFRSDLSRNGRGFQLQYVTMCNNTLTGFGGVIESPNFPNNYPSSVNCNWEILVAERNKINISFSHFDLEKVIPNSLDDTSNDKCIYDFVEISYIEHVQEYEEEGPFKKHGSYCGDQIPPLISLDSNHAKIHFVSDNLLHGNGFRLEWQIDGCGDVLTRPNGTITSPNYPKPYPALVECNWKIKVDFGYHIEITFYKLELEKTFVCHLDYITLYNGEDDTYPEIGNICHQNKPITLHSSGNYMFIKFKADISVQGSGFYANYTSKPTKCGGKYVADRASIMSPNYPQNYDKNDTCGYEIEVTEGHMISLRFESFDLFSPPNLDCNVNNVSYVKVYDGPTVSYPLLAKICGRNAPNDTLNSTTNKMYVEMVTQTDAVAKGFLAKYRKSCGARIEAEGTGIIRLSPNDLDYDEYNCSWIIVAKDPSKHVSLTITHLDPINGYCDETVKSLQIFNGESPSAPLLGSYCGSKIPPTLTSDGSALYINIEYNSVFFATYSVYDSHCGGTLTSLEGFFASPGYPKQYPIDTECEWTIEVTEGNHVSLSFTYFGLLDSEHCNTDYLEIRQNNGTGKLLGTFCGEGIPSNITNAGSLWIFLKTSRVEGDTSAINAKGFYAEYILSHENELSGPSGRIVSPLHNRDYPLYGEFSWRISVNFGKRILLTFKELNLESGNDMCFSSVNVYDGDDDQSSLIKEYCDIEIPKSIKSSSNVLFVKFVGYGSGRSVTRFILEWLEIDTIVPQQNAGVNKTGCGTIEPLNINLLKNFTKITSPGYPYGYAPNLLCEWTIFTIPMNRLRVFFMDMDLQPNYGMICYSDYVEILEKTANTDWTSVVKTCHENITTGPSISTSNMLKVVFRSDRYGNRTGFSLFVREDCGGTLTAPTDYIIFDNTTRANYMRSFITACQWNITVRAGRTIEIEFLSFEIHHNEDKGCDNYLLIQNGKFPDSPVLGQGKYCGTALPTKLSTSGNNAYVKFKGVTNLSNFKIRYREVSYSCGGRMTLTHRSRNISSPNYPNSPPPHIECLWIISAPPGEVIRIDFPGRFDLLAEKECTDEYLEVRDGGTIYSKLIGKFCSAKPNSQFSTNNMLFVKFFTEVNEPGNGFTARVVLANCGGTVYDKLGQIQSPFFNVPAKYPVNANCTWHLKSPSNHNMVLKFNKIDLEEARDCTTVDHVNIYEENLADSGVNSLGNYCGKVIPNPIETSGSEAIVHFETGKTKKELGGFALQFNASLDACGGTIEASQGIIKSPGYPRPHKGYRNCAWFIKVPSGRRVTLKVVDFDMDSRLTKLWLNGLSIYNTNNFRGFIKKITANDAVKAAESSENTMFVFYWSKGNAGRGFKATFSSNEPSVCEGDFNRDSGTITQPNVNYTYLCTYVRRKPSTQAKSLVMRISTKTNATKSEKVNCLGYIAKIKVETEDGMVPLGLIDCVPSTTVLRIPYSNVKVEAMEVNPRNKVNFTISYDTYNCGGILRNEMGTIKSPGYPNKYSSSIECSWLIDIPKEQSILLTFEDMDLGDNCEKSFVDLYNGNSPQSPKIDRYCQSNKPDLIKSQGNNLLIEYKFDQDSNGKGFSIKYEPQIKGCGGMFHDRSRIIQSPSFPNDYPNNAECLWELRSDVGYHIGLVFTTRFQIEQSDNCKNDYVEIWDWSNNEWSSLGKKCGRDVPNTINSTSNRMRIMFRSNDKTSGKGFRAQWDWNCGGTFIADNTERFVVSPGFPSNYKKNLKCHYNISAIESEFVNIKFYNFDLEGTGSNCRFDNLTISNSWNRGNRYLPFYRQIYCGQKSPPNIRLTGTVYMKFQTDSWVQRSGFKFSYQLDNCGGNINSPTVINSPSMNMERVIGLYNGFMQCTWNITAPFKKSVVIEFQEFNFVYRRNCYFGNVEIYEGSQIMRSRRIANLCGDLSANLPVIKSDNGSVIMSLRVDRTTDQHGFKAEVFFKDGPEAGCGGKINLEGTTSITAPDLPDMDCSWFIQSPLGTNIKLHFNELNLPSTCGLKNHTHGGCSCATLEVKDGHPDVAELIEKFCGVTSTSFTRELSTSANGLGIRLRTRGVNRKAFKITLTAAPSPCGPVYLNATDHIQTLVSPGYPHKYPSDLRCTWVIKGVGNTMVHFVDFDLNEENNQHVVTNVCNEDKLQIVDESERQIIADGLGPTFTLAGNRKSQAEFTRYTLMSGVHQFCGKSDKPFDYYSDLFTIVVKFYSGNIERNRGKGFKLEYHLTGCNRNYTSLQGHITNVVKQDCYQTITVPKNYTISLFFQKFFVYSSVNCEKVGVEIRDGADKSGVLLQKSCGYALPNPVFSSTNKLWIHSWNSMGRSWPGTYDLVYTSSDQGKGCGGTLYNYKGSFTSPLHPMGYKNSTACKWDVRVPIGMKVAIKFTVFDIQGDCEHNYLKVTTYDKEDSNDHKFCKNDDPAPLYSNSHLLVTYQSSANNGGTGWHALFEAVSQ